MNKFIKLTGITDSSSVYINIANIIYFKNSLYPVPYGFLYLKERKEPCTLIMFNVFSDKKEKYNVLKYNVLYVKESLDEILNLIKNCS